MGLTRLGDVDKHYLYSECKSTKNYANTLGLLNGQ